MGEVTTVTSIKTERRLDWTEEMEIKSRGNGD